ncbi:MAG: SDR family NAD(P)-dependent oxidoreductase [Anaerolineae bacterium]|nr:SDR family NAD(P)-dependent oxidoreductase [Anaerolineae bacterium]
MTNSNRIALITGVSVGGTGLATAVALSKAGWTVYAGARRPETLSDLEGLHLLKLDVTDEASIQTAIQTIRAHGHSVDVLVNNAAYGEMGTVEEVPIARIRQQFETNVFGLVRMCQLVLPMMRQNGWGRIINVSSMGGEFTTPFAGFYHATKYAVESLSDALRIEVEQFGVDVVVVQPGGINTPLAQQTVDAIPSEENSPYAAQLSAFRQFSQQMSSMFDQIAVLPERVAEVIVSAIQADKPLTRYKVLVQDMSSVNFTRNAADRERDNGLRQQFGLIAP